jgi:serine/threonine-protein kinase
MSYPEQPPIPGYEPVRLLGINCGAVYLARHASTGALVALKVWPLKFVGHARDYSEAQAALDHPNIIRVLGMGEFEGEFFCAFEYVERTMADKLREGPLPGVDVARLIRAIVSALQYALDQGMTAESLAPHSVFLTDDDVPKLWWFCPSEAFGKPPNPLSPALMVPEWALGTDTGSEASHVYRVGALMYEMLTARPPFTGANALAMMVRVLQEMPEPPRRVNPSVGRALDAVCMKCLAKEPKARYASLQELLDHLEPYESS